MILPLGSMRKFCGMPCTWYRTAALFSQNLRSLTCVQARLSVLIAFNQGSFSLSSDTPKTVKFLLLNFLKVFTTFGFSIRQGRHQLAQKSTSTYLPRKEE